MLRITKEQRRSLKCLWLRQTATSYRDFRALVQPTIGCDGAVVVPWCNMWIVIEKDGYAHS